MAVNVKSKVYPFEVNGKQYAINGGDPEMLGRVQGWEGRYDDLTVPDDNAISLEKYLKMEAFARDIIGDAQYDDIFGDTRDVLLLMALVQEISPMFVEIMNDVEASAGMLAG